MILAEQQKRTSAVKASNYMSVYVAALQAFERELFPWAQHKLPSFHHDTGACLLLLAIMGEKRTMPKEKQTVPPI